MEILVSLWFLKKGKVRQRLKYYSMLLALPGLFLAICHSVLSQVCGLLSTEIWPLPSESSTCPPVWDRRFAERGIERFSQCSHPWWAEMNWLWLPYHWYSSSSFSFCRMCCYCPTLFCIQWRERDLLLTQVNNVRHYVIHAVTKIWKFLEKNFLLLFFVF